MYDDNLVLSDFEFLDSVGRGSYSVVYLTRFKETDELMALKSTSIEYLLK